MKSLISMFGFASLLMLSFAFSPAEKIAEEASMMCIGEFGACVTSVITPGTTATINIYEEGTTNLAASSNALSCSTTSTTLQPGTYDVVIETNASSAINVTYEWKFCNGTVTGSGSASVNGSLQVGQIDI